LKTLLVKEIMVPLAEYATVYEDATLTEAVIALKKAQEHFSRARYRHRAVLVLNREKRLVGKLSQHDVIRALEPNYQRVKELGSLSRFGLNPRFIEAMLEQYGLWRTPLGDLCRTAARLRVKEIMYAPEEGEYIEEDASITRALHRLVVGSHHSLLVTNNLHEIVGVLRLTDLFSLICGEFEGCEKSAVEPPDEQFWSGGS
jgi:CBS domain-containing protein